MLFDAHSQTALHRTYVSHFHIDYESQVPIR
jgi:hypothetical protein